MSGEDATARPHAPRLIVVEDDLALQDALVGYLRLCGFDVVTESTAVAFYDRVVREMFDVAVIDTGVAPVKYLDSADAVVNGPDLSLDRQVGLGAGDRLAERHLGAAVGTHPVEEAVEHRPVAHAGHAATADAPFEGRELVE